MPYTSTYNTRGVAPYSVLGIDPGIRGAVVAVYGNHIQFAEDMPTEKHGKRTRVDSQELTDLVWYLMRSLGARCVVMEAVASLPNDGHVGAFSFGDASGVCRGVLAGVGLDVAFVAPTFWKRHYNLIKCGKGASIALAGKYFVNAPQFIRLKKHEGRAEAALMARLWLTIAGKR